MKRKTKEQRIKRVTWIKVRHGEDLLKALTDYCLENNVQLGFISIIGALQRVNFNYYHQKEKKYYKNSIEEPVEIVSCAGNVSMKEGKPFIHAHLAVADRKGNVFGGHLEEGTIVFAAECVLFELEGDLMERKFDKTTGLFLWDFS